MRLRGKQLFVQERETAKLSPEEHWRDCGERTKIGEIINFHKNSISPESVILVTDRSWKILMYLTACLFFSWSKERYSLPLQTLTQSYPEAVMAARALSIRRDVSFCPAGKLARSSRASPRRWQCSTSSFCVSLSIAHFPIGARWTGGRLSPIRLWCPVSV